MPLGSRSIAQALYMIDTEAFGFVVGPDFFVEYPQILSLKLQAPYVSDVDHADTQELAAGEN